MRVASSPSRLCALAAACLLLLVGATPTPAPAELANRFLRSFEKKDFATLRSLFAPGAQVTSITYTPDGSPQPSYGSAESWVKRAESELAAVQDYKVEILETSNLAFHDYATVSIRFRAEGKAGGAFQLEGIDTYTFVRFEDTWKILQYGYVEHIKPVPAARP